MKNNTNKNKKASKIMVRLFLKTYQVKEGRRIYRQKISMKDTENKSNCPSKYVK